jgi:hypothetical protein
MAPPCLPHHKKAYRIGHERAIPLKVERTPPSCGYSTNGQSRRDLMVDDAVPGERVSPTNRAEDVYTVLNRGSLKTPPLA